MPDAEHSFLAVESGADRPTAKQYQQEQPLDYSRPGKAGALEMLRIGPPFRWLKNSSRLVAVIAAGVGSSLLVFALISFWSG